MLRKLNKFQQNFSLPGKIYARARYRVAAQWLRNTALWHGRVPSGHARAVGPVGS